MNEELEYIPWCATRTEKYHYNMGASCFECVYAFPKHGKAKYLVFCNGYKDDVPHLKATTCEFYDSKVY